MKGGFITAAKQAGRNRQGADARPGLSRVRGKANPRSLDSGFPRWKKRAGPSLARDDSRKKNGERSDRRVLDLFQEAVAAVVLGAVEALAQDFGGVEGNGKIGEFCGGEPAGFGGVASGA